MKYRVYLKYAAVVLTFLLLLLLLFRNMLLNSAFQYAAEKVQERYHTRVSLANLRFSGIDNVVMEEVVLQPLHADTLLHIHQAVFNLSLLDLMTAKIGFDNVDMDSISVTVFNDSLRNNIRVLKPAKSEPAVKNKVSTTGYLALASAYKRQLFRALHTAFHLTHVSVSYADSSYLQQIDIPVFDYDLKNFSANIIPRHTTDTILLSGEVLQKNKEYSFHLTQSQKHALYLPFLNKEKGLNAGVEELTARVNLNDKRDELQIVTDFAARELRVNHWRIANEDVVINRAQFKSSFHISDHALELDSSSTFKISNVPVTLFMRYQQQPQPVFTLAVKMPETKADTFFHSLPSGMFSTLKGISCSGTLAYELDFEMNTNRPDSLVFTSALSRKNFRINHYGSENFSRINEPFVYEAFDKDRFVRNITIGSSNPSFTPLGNISPYLVKSVLQSEDPSFMQHRGFLMESFRESIVKNYKEKRFARGGSTISMQLVKNVFLSRNKTISRKLEEALIVYLIENLGLVSKERMLEIYLNVIEWGPDVYGIGEAARFYFNKSPRELNLQESIFLAGIIPRPKFFKYQFDKQGKLRPYLSGYFNILSRRMVFKGWITEADTLGLRPDVELKGRALQLIVPADSLPAVNEEFIFETE